MATNIELKARLVDLEPARAVAQEVATDYLGVQLQTDTYFVCSQGRLKLREIRQQQEERAELIWYERPDEATAKASQYLITPVPVPGPLKESLRRGFGQWLVVEKRREIFLHQQVRIHLDEVQRLGTFLEFEAVLGPELDAEKGQQLVGWLQDRFQIAAENLLEGSYSDLLAATDGG